MSPTRRDFLKGVAGTVAALVAVPVAQAAKPRIVKNARIIAGHTNPYLPADYTPPLHDHPWPYLHGTLMDIKRAAHSVPGVHHVKIQEMLPEYPGHIFLRVNANPHEVLRAVDGVLPAHIQLHVTAPFPIMSRTRVIEQTIKVKFG